MREKLSRSKIICLGVVVLCCTQCQSVRLPYNDGGIAFACGLILVHQSEIDQHKN